MIARKLLILTLAFLLSSADGQGGNKPRDRPDKDPTDCEGMEWSPDDPSSRPPCQYGKGSEDENSHPAPPGMEDQGAPPAKRPLPEDNELTISVYMGMKPWQPSAGRPLIVAVAQYLNVTMYPNVFGFGPRPGPPNRKLEKGGQRRLDGDEEEEEEEERSWKMLYDFTSSKVVQKHDAIWWWQYNLTYHCWWPATLNPVLDSTLLNNFANRMEDNLDEGTKNQQPFLKLLRRRAKDDSIQVLVHFSAEDFPDEVNIVDDPSEDDPDSFFDDSTVPLHTYQAALDTSLWDWRRYFGLGMFLFVFFGTLFVSSFAAYEQRRLSRHENWGNLGSEKGVNQLLNLAWKVEHNGIQVFDKGTVGYQEGDSMLIGGFEQKQPYGSEITITQPTGTTDSRSRSAADSLTDDQPSLVL